MISFKSIGHFFAKAFQAIKNDTPKVAGAIDKVDAEKGVVEDATALTGHAEVIPLEDAAFAALGALAAFLHAGGDAAAKNLTDLGLDAVAVQKAQQAYAQYPHVAAIAKSL